MKLKTRWRKLSNAVYENRNGSRVHVGGMIRVENNKHYSADNWQQSALYRILIKMHGYNRKRALMDWAERTENWT